MERDRVQSRADGLAARVEALATALEATGVAEEASARILAHASAAALQALTLELLLDDSERAAVPPPTRLAKVETRPALALRPAA